MAYFQCVLAKEIVVLVFLFRSCLVTGSGKINIRGIHFFNFGSDASHPGIVLDIKITVRGVNESQAPLTIESKVILNGTEPFLLSQNINNQSKNALVWPFAREPPALQFHVNVFETVGNASVSEVGKSLRVSFDQIIKNTSWTRDVTLKKSGIKILTLSVSKVCDLHFYGSKCDKFCSPTERYNCSSKGEKMCLSGWENPAADCNETGKGCDQKPCKNRGVCIEKIGDGYLCNCPGKYFGVNCEHFDCEYSACENGLCQEKDGSFRCKCNAGFEGSRCEHDINECLFMPCLNGGTCLNQVGGFNCTCHARYTGPRCENTILKDFCQPSPCNNNGICQNTDDGYACRCVDDYAGRNCSEDKNECRSSPCENGATCVIEPDGFSCNCPSTFHGPLCDEDKDECVGAFKNFCQNNSTCFNLRGGFRCKCKFPYIGKNCGEVLEAFENQKPTSINLKFVLIGIMSGSLCAFGFFVLAVQSFIMWKRYRLLEEYSRNIVLEEENLGMGDNESVEMHKEEPASVIQITERRTFMKNLLSPKQLRNTSYL